MLSKSEEALAAAAEAAMAKKSNPHSLPVNPYDIT
jgi:hypothetical protein